MDLNECCMAKLLVESKESKPGVLSTVKGTFMELDVKNRNGRIYSRPLVVERIIQEPYVKEMLEAGMLLGEAKHPEDRFEVDMEKASHVITNLWVDEEENVLKGEADILDTPCGRIVNTLVQYGSSVGISARARGNVKETKEGQVVLKESYRFKTFDFVLTPGFAKSRLEQVNEGLREVKESIDNIIEGSSDESLESIKALLRSVDEEYFEDSIKLIEKRESSLETIPLEEKNLELVAKVTELELQVDEMAIDMSYMVSRTEVDNANRQIASLEEQLENRTAEIENLQEKTSKIEILESLVSSLTEANQTLKDNLEESESLLLIMASKVEQSISMYESRLQEREEEIKSLREKVNALEESCQELKESSSFLEDEERPIILVEGIIEDNPLTEEQIRLRKLIGGIKNGK